MDSISKPARGNFRRLYWIFLPLTVVLIMGGLIYAIRTLDGYVSHQSAKITEYIQRRYGLSCTVGALHYSFPFHIRASKVSIMGADSRLWMKAEDISARINPVNCLLSGKLSPEAVSGIKASNLEVFFYHHDDSGWDLAGPLRPAPSKTSASPAESRSLELTVNDLTLFFNTPRHETKHYYKKLAAGNIGRDGEGYLELEGAGDERLRVSFQRETGAFRVRAESFRLAVLSPFLGRTIPLDDIYITADAKGTPDKNGPLSFRLSGDVSVKENKKVPVPDLLRNTALIKIEAAGTTDKEQTRIQKGEILIGGQSISLTGQVVNRRRPQVDLHLAFPDFSIGKAVETVPPRFYPDLPELKVTGRLRGIFHFFIDFEEPQSLRYDFHGKYEPIKVLALSSKIDIKALASPFRHTALRTDGKRISFIVGEKNPAYTPISRMPQSVVAAVITAEDGGFFKHRGFSSLHIRDSFVENLKAGHVIRGASTITMQLAKNLYLSPERTFSRKFAESFITIALEQTLSKERIIEIYLNIIEWGDGIYGIGPAAQYYFHKSPADLTPVESAFLASIIPYPRKKWGADPLANISEGWRQYLQLILCRMYERGGAEVDDLSRAGVDVGRIARLVRNKGVDGEAAPVPGKGAEPLPMKGTYLP